MKTSMKFVCILFTFSLVKIIESHESTVPEWSEEEFLQKHAEKKSAIVMFYAPWCGHCKSFMPTFDEFVSKSETELPTIAVGKIDGTKQAKLSQKYHVTGYPTIIMIQEEKSCVYSGEREITSLTTWAKGFTSRSVIDSQEMVDSVLSSPLASVVVFLKKEDTTLQQIVSDLICQGGIAVPGGLHIVESQEWAEKLKFPQGKSLVVIKAGSEHHVFNGELSMNDISSFLAFSSHPLLMKYSMETSSAIFHSSIVHYLFLNLKKSEQQDQMKLMLPLMEQVAGEFFGQVRVSWVDVETEDGKSAMNFFGIHHTPSLVALNYTSGLIYADLSSETTSALEPIREFLVKYLNHQLKPHRKEEPQPEDWATGPVYQLVAGNFHQVLQMGKPVFVMFHAPWCGHCKALMPHWEKLASQYFLPEDKSSIIIAKLDATKNDIEGVTIEHFPTLIAFLPDGTKVTYDGERTPDALKAFVDSGFKKSSDDKAKKSSSADQESEVQDNLSTEEEEITGGHDEL